MNKYILSQYPSTIYVEDFDRQDWEYYPAMKSGTQRYDRATGKHLGTEERDYKPSKEELAQLQPTIARIVRSGYDAHWVCTVGPEICKFKVQLFTEKTVTEYEFLNVVRDAISNIVELDNIARARTLKTEKNYEEQLNKVYFDADTQEICLEYWSTAVNTSWVMAFKKNEQGEWEFSQWG